MTYNFLLLALLFLLPGLVIFLARADLRPVIGLMAVCSLPFALTESLFYPSYWEPVFLFDLARRIGFGIEDVLFVVGMAGFTSTVYAAARGRRYVAHGATDARAVARRALATLALTFVLVGLAALASVPMIFGSFAIMLLVSAGMVLLRRDLVVPGLLGGLLSLAVYTALCLIFAWLLPDIFQLAWHSDQFSNLFVLGVPLEELMYGFASGVAATVFYPFAFGRRFDVRRG